MRPARFLGALCLVALLRPPKRSTRALLCRTLTSRDYRYGSPILDRAWLLRGTPKISRRMELRLSEIKTHSIVDSMILHRVGSVRSSSPLTKG